MEQRFKAKDRVRVVREATTRDWSGNWIHPDMDLAIRTEMEVLRAQINSRGCAVCLLAAPGTGPLSGDPRGTWWYPETVLEPAVYGNEED